MTNCHTYHSIKFKKINFKILNKSRKSNFLKKSVWIWGKNSDLRLSIDLRIVGDGGPGTRFSLQTLWIFLAHNKRRTTALLLQIAQYLVNYCPLHTKYRNEAISLLDDNTVHAFLQEAYITEIKSSHNSGNHD